MHLHLCVCLTQFFRRWQGEPVASASYSGATKRRSQRLRQRRRRRASALAISSVKHLLNGRHKACAFLLAAHTGTQMTRVRGRRPPRRRRDFFCCLSALSVNQAGRAREPSQLASVTTSDSVPAPLAQLSLLTAAVVRTRQPASLSAALSALVRPPVFRLPLSLVFSAPLRRRCLRPGASCTTRRWRSAQAFGSPFLVAPASGRLARWAQRGRLVHSRTPLVASRAEVS